jgi:hypothetical protein
MPTALHPQTQMTFKFDGERDAKSDRSFYVEKSVAQPRCQNLRGNDLCRRKDHEALRIQ